MKLKKTASAVLLMSFLWTLPASAQILDEVGVWYAVDLDGSNAWVAFDGTSVVSFDSSSQFGCGAGVLAAYADSYNYDVTSLPPVISGTVEVRCKGNVANTSFPYTLTYDVNTGGLEGTFGRSYRKVHNADPNSFINIIRKWKTNSPEEWAFLGLVTDARPVFVPIPGQGADCTDPPNIGPGVDLTNCDLAGVDLTGVDFTDAVLSGAILNEAALGSVIWSNTTCPDTSNSDLNDGDGFTCTFNLGSEPPCAPDAYELNETQSEAYDLGMLTDTAGGGGGNQGATGHSCNGFGRQYEAYNNDFTPLDLFDDSAEYVVQVQRDPSAPHSCDTYTLNVSNGPVGALDLVTVTGNIASEFDTDWYRFYAVDDLEGTTAEDSWRINIELFNSPDHRLRVFRNSVNQCPSSFP